MRKLVVVALVGCAAPARPVTPSRVERPSQVEPAPVQPHDETPPFDLAAARPEPALSMFTHDGSVFLLVAESEHANCQAWTYKAEEDRRGRLLGDHVALELHSSGTTLELTRVVRFAGATPPDWQPSSDASYGRDGARCDLSWAAREARDGDGVDADDARWFASRASCEAAIAHRLPVATDLSACLPHVPATPAQAAATRRAFEHTLGHGGALFEVASGATRCDRIQVEPSGQDGRSHGGVLARVSFEDATARVETLTQYMASIGSDTIGFASAGARTIKKTPDAFDAGSYATMCAHDEPLAFGADVVAHGAETFYLSLAACRAAIPKLRARAAWFTTPSSSAAGC